MSTLYVLLEHEAHTAHTARHATRRATGSVYKPIVKTRPFMIEPPSLFCVSVPDLCTLCSMLNFLDLPNTYYLSTKSMSVNTCSRMLSRSLNITALTRINISASVSVTGPLSSQPNTVFLPPLSLPFVFFIPLFVEVSKPPGLF